MFSQPFLIGDVHIEGHGKPYCLSPKDYATLPAGSREKVVLRHVLFKWHFPVHGRPCLQSVIHEVHEIFLFVDEVLGRASHLASQNALPSLQNLPSRVSKRRAGQKGRKAS